MLLFVLLVSVSLEAFTLENGYDRAYRKAIQSNKMLIVFLTKKKCAYCNEELMKIINCQNISSLIEKNAVFVVVYKKQKDTFPIEMLYTTQYPTLFFLDKDELFSCKALQGDIDLKDISNCLKAYALLVKHYRTEPHHI